MRSSLRYATSLLTLLAVTQAPLALAQSKAEVADIDSRLQRVERVLDQSLLGVVQRIDGLQREIRELRGEVENLTYEMETLKKRNRELYRDTNSRITTLESAQKTDDFGLDGDDFLDEDALDGEDGLAAQDAEADNPQAVFVPEDQPAESAGNGIDLAAFGDGPKPPPLPITGESVRSATQVEKGAYTKAYDLLARGQNEDAVGAFDEFLLEYSDGPYSDNAWYWQGEAMYAQRKFDEALRNFNVVVRSFPNSPKVPDARLKIGFALFEQQQFKPAREVLTAVQNDYPGRSAAVLARKRLQQMDREGK